jgi:phosphotransferase system HPr (HPr) family protein
MKEESVKIEYPYGIHMRPAEKIARMASTFKSEIFIHKEDRKVSAKSILSLLSLAVAHQNEIIVSAEGEDEKKAVKAIIKLIKSKFSD